MTDNEGCVWPRKFTAADVRDQLVRAAVASGVEVLTDCRVRRVSRDIDGWRIALADRTLTSRFLCLATGGASYPGTGSSGDGLELCSTLGLATTGWYPALCSLQPRQDVRALAGITQPSVTLSLLVGGDPVRSTAGHFIFAHRFISGSAILNLSGHAAKALARGEDVELAVDWVPSHGCAELAAEFRAGKQYHGRRLVANWLMRFAARRLADRVVADAGVPAGRRMAELTRPETEELVRVLKKTVFDIVGTEPMERATVCGGGVALDEVDLATCESRRFPGLYVIGELLDTWAETGGYNLHFAWATGISAGEAVAARFAQESNG